MTEPQTNPSTKRGTVSKKTTNNPLSHLVPPSWYEDDYLAREIDGVSDLDWLDAQEALSHAVLIDGPTGCGKTSCVYAWAAREQLPVVNIPCSRSVEAETLVGRWVPTIDGQFDFVLGDMALALQHGGVILFDEVDRLDAETWSHFHSLTDKRQSISIPQASGSSAPTQVVRGTDVRLLIVGTRNPSYGHRPMDPATLNRFQGRLAWGYDPTIEAQLIPESPQLVALAVRLRQLRDNGDMLTETPTNALIEFIVIHEKLGFDAAVGNFCRRFDPDEADTVLPIVEQWLSKIAADLKVKSWKSIHIPSVERI